MVDRCVCCGTIIPEGSMVCQICKEDRGKDPVQDKPTQKIARNPSKKWTIFGKRMSRSCYLSG